MLVEIFEEALRSGASKEDAIAVAMDNGFTLSEIDAHIAMQQPDYVESLRQQKGAIRAYALMNIKKKAKKMDDHDFALTLAERLDKDYIKPTKLDLTSKGERVTGFTLVPPDTTSTPTQDV
jgi:hypothetical protein